MARCARPHDDVGTSLVEVLVAVVILGIAVPGLLTGLATAAITSGVHRSQTDAHVVIVSAAEALRDDARNPFSCAPTSYDLLDGVQLPAGWSPADVQLDVGAAQAGSWVDGAFQVAVCSATTDLQRLTLRATSPDGRAVEQLTVFKRRP